MNKKILLVEDDASLSLTIESYLENDYSVYCADNCIKAFSIMKNTKVDVVLLDLSLPGMCGLEIMKEALKYRKKLSVIVLTADAHENTVREAIKDGAVDYIAKPVTREVLSERIKRAIQRKLVA